MKRLVMGWARIAALVSACVLAGCADLIFTSAGERSPGFREPATAAAYIPLEGPRFVFLQGIGAAVVIEPGIAVTNAHNANLVRAADIVGESSAYDLLFFRTAHQSAAPAGRPEVGRRVIAYGQGAGRELRQAEGTVRLRGTPVAARCPDCPLQRAFTFDADAGRGFSGGPVVDVASGAVVGIIFGYRDGPAGTRLMYAYEMDTVTAEYRRLVESGGPR